MIDLADHIADIARQLEAEGRLGERTKGQQTHGEWRYGKHGSLSIVVGGPSRGDWYDHENREGGGPRELIQIKGGYDARGLNDWLRKIGIDPDDRDPILKTYDYTDEHGALLFQVVRKANHKFLQRRRGDDGGWIWKLGNTRRVLYHLPELIAAKAAGNGHPPRVYLCEGEKDADRLRQDWGVCATTNPMGANNWRDEYDNYFSGFEVVLLEDNDEAGRKRSAALAPRLARAGAIVRVASFPHLDDGGDISDWIEGGGSQSDLETLIEDTEPQRQPKKPEQGDAVALDPKTPWLHPLEPFTSLDFSTLDDNPSFVREWAVPDWFPMLETVGFGGPGAEGKTLLAQMFGTAAALGEGCLGLPFAEMKTTLVLCEDYAKDAHLRQADINRHFGCKMRDLAGRLRILPRRTKLFNYLGIFDNDGNLHTTSFFDQLVEDLKSFGSKFNVLDGRGDIFRGDQNNEHHARTFVRQVTDRIAQATEGVVLMIYQPSRAGRIDGTGESGSAQWDAAFRARTYLQPAGKDDDPTIRRLIRKKSNFAAKNEEIEIRWDKGVFVDARAAAEPGQPIYEMVAKKAKAERVFLSMLDKMTRLNSPVSSSKNALNYAPRKFAEHPDMNDGCTREDLERAMNDLMFVKEVITNEPYGRNTRIVKVVATAT